MVGASFFSELFGVSLVPGIAAGSAGLAQAPSGSESCKFEDNVRLDPDWTQQFLTSADS